MADNDSDDSFYEALFDEFFELGSEKLFDVIFELLKRSACSEVVSTTSESRAHAEPDPSRDFFVLYDFMQGRSFLEMTLEKVVSFLLKKINLSVSSKNTIGTKRSCLNMVLAAEVLGWSQETRDEMRNFLNDLEITDSIDKWMSKIAQGEDRPVLDISRPLPNAMSMDTFKLFIGYYGTDRFACNFNLLRKIFLLSGSKPQA